MRHIAIVGGGPAGSLCGERLARAGFSVTICDERPGWEKPCGGGLTHKAIVAYPFLLNGAQPKRIITHAELIADGGRRASFPIEHPLVIYSRATLNSLLLERALAAGCRLVEARVTRLDVSQTRPRLTLAHHQQKEHQPEFDFVVVAAGARNALLPETPPLPPEDLEITLGYLVPQRSETLQVKFLGNLEGYLWSFPRLDHLSVGICGRMTRHSSRELRVLLHQFLAEESIPIEAAEFYSHVLPSPRALTLRNRPVAGANWALAGDAAALVDPLTGEGIYYAMRSGDLLAQSLIAADPAGYPARLRTDFSADLATAATLTHLFYAGRFLGGAKTTRMVQFAKLSPTFRRLVSDIFAGSQKYDGLRRRLWTQLPRTLCEILATQVRERTTPSGVTSPKSSS
jgi:flavin-dependent dehydrogenase